MASKMDSNVESTDPFNIECTSNSVFLDWSTLSKSLTEIEADFYTVKYKLKEAKTRRFLMKETNEANSSIVLEGLKADSEYEILVFASHEGIDEKIFQTKVRTDKSMAELLMLTADKVGSDPVIYQMKPQIIQQLGNSVRLCDMISDFDKDNSEEKIILLLGQTGSGKSTLIDAIFNYIPGVSPVDDYRFKLIHLTEDEKKKEHKTSMSLTDQITCYRIPRKDGSTVRFKLCIVDTPGFGDVRGTNFDKTIIEMVKHLFRKGIQNIDALCLVMKLSDKRLTDSQQYVFSSILEIFAKDISDNIFVLLTNDDGEAGKPQALDALTEAKVPYKEDMVFRFKNGNLFNSESNESEWKARNTSFKNFFDKLQTIGKISVENTKTVLNTRESLEIQLDNIQKKIRYQAVEILHIKRDENALKLHEVDIEKNKNFTITKEVQRPTTVSRQSYCLNCKHCNATCHYDCKVVLDCLILTCVMMTWKKCTSCSCYSDKHALEKLSHETKIVSETQTLSDIKMQYSVAMQGAEGYKEMINKNKVNLRESLLELDKMIQKAGDWIKQLQNEALQPAVRNMDEYIDRILAKENEKEHIEIIKMVKKKASANRSMTDLINDL